MRKSIILLLGLVLLFAIPALASTPENENMPAPTSEDQQFMGLAALSEEELINITGNQLIINDPSLTLIESSIRPTKDIPEWALKQGLQYMGLSDKTINIILNYFRSKTTLRVSVYQDENGNLLVIFSAF